MYLGVKEDFDDWPRASWLHRRGLTLRDPNVLFRIMQVSVAQAGEARSSQGTRNMNVGFRDGLVDDTFTAAAAGPELSESSIRALLGDPG